MFSAQWSLYRILIMLVAVAVVAGSGCTVEYRPSYRKAHVTFAAVRVPGSLPVFVAQEEGLFKEYGLDVTLTGYPVGRAAVRDVGSGKADVGTAADTAVMLSLLDGAKVLLPACICIADAGNAIVGRKDRGIATAADLRGKTVGVTQGTTAEYFLDVFLLLHGVPDGTVRRQYLPENRLVPALRGGVVDALATWNPITTEAAEATRSESVILQARDYFDTFYMVTANEEFVRKNPEVVQRLLLALRAATDLITEQPARAAAILRKYTGEKRQQPLDGYHYDITLEQSLIISMRNALTWASGKGHEASENINFMDYFYFDGLQAIDPDVVSVLR